EAQHARLLRQPVGHSIERIRLLLVFLQLVVHRLHEAVEVAALLVAERQALEEQVHQPGLAAADAAPHVQAALQLVQLAARKQAAEELFAEQPLGLGSDQALAQPVESCDDLLLRGIGLVSQASALALVKLDDLHAWSSGRSLK